MRYYFASLFLVTVLGISILGFRAHVARKPPLEFIHDMKEQPKLRPQTAAAFFPDGLSSRVPVAGTIARGAPHEDLPVYTGKAPGTTNFVECNPLPVTAELLEIGRQRFQVYCQPCHSPIGDGNGIVIKYGLLKAGNYHEPRLVRMADGEIFNTITYGKNLMSSYASQVSVTNRWAVISYIRALQRSRLADMNDVPEQVRPSLMVK